MTNIRIKEWGEKWVERFNELSAKYEVPYYTQSPLNLVGDRIDIMFVGINPKGGNKGVTNRTLDNFLAGNECWGQRFCGDKNVWKFTNGARFFMGYDVSKHVDTIDNDHKVVWTNLTPFQSDKGFTDLKAELRDEGVKSTLELISILKPEKVVFLGGNAFGLLDKYADNNLRLHFEHIKVFGKLPLEIGRLYNIPAYYVSHPSGKWPVSHCFISVFVFLRNLIDIYENDKPTKSLKTVAESMRKEFALWHDRIETMYLLSGDYDFMCIVKGRTMQEVAHFVASKLACIPGVTGTKTTFVLKPYKTDGHVLVDDEDGKNTRLVVTP